MREQIKGKNKMNSTQKTMLETLEKTFNIKIDYDFFSGMPEEKIEEEIKKIEEKLFYDLANNKNLTLK